MVQLWSVYNAVPCTVVCLQRDMFSVPELENFLAVLTVWRCVFAVGHVQCSWAGELPRYVDSWTVWTHWQTTCKILSSQSSSDQQSKTTAPSTLTIHSPSVHLPWCLSVFGLCYWSSLGLFWSCVKLPQILHFWPHFLGGGGPQFSDLHYKSHPDSDHVAKFHGYQPRELGDRVAK